MADAPPLTEVRLDRWLWAARFFKTRSLATAACLAGHVKVNGASAKAAKSVRIGDRLEVRTPGGDKIVAISKLGDRRGPAPAARELYEDHTPPPPPRDELPPQAAARERGTGRPSKRERRLIDKLRGL
ncbi:MAG: RNA-binding S4 domain-containing protein [Myxococcales bacterium]|nr:RNA-binding S4 domain-containing protein [Myxococcales bacterium]